MTNSTASKGPLIRWGLRGISIVLLVVAVGFWISTGSHTGFSKNRVEVTKLDPITEIEYIEYEDRFIMGVEYLGAAAVAASVLFGLSFFFGRSKS